MDITVTIIRSRVSLTGGGGVVDPPASPGASCTAAASSVPRAASARGGTRCTWNAQLRRRDDDVRRRLVGRWGWRTLWWASHDRL